MFKRVTRNPRDIVIDYIGGGNTDDGGGGGTEMMQMKKTEQQTERRTTNKVSRVGTAWLSLKNTVSTFRGVLAIAVCALIWATSLLFIASAIWPSELSMIKPTFLLAGGALLLILKGTVGVLYSHVPNEAGIAVKKPWLEKYGELDVLPHSTTGIDILGIALIVTFICKWGGEYIRAFFDTIMILVQILRLMACLARPFISFMDAILKIPLIGGSLTTNLDKLLDVADKLAADACPIS
jgi:hypothetical protein